MQSPETLTGDRGWCERKTASLVELINHGPNCEEPDCDWTSHGEFDFAGDWFVFREWELEHEFRLCRLDANPFCRESVRTVKWPWPSTSSETWAVRCKLRKGRLLMWQPNVYQATTKWISVCCETGEQLSGICQTDSWQECFPVHSERVGWLTLKKYGDPCIHVRSPTMQLLGAISTPSGEYSRTIQRVFSWDSSPGIVCIRYEAGNTRQIRPPRGQTLFRGWQTDFDVRNRTFAGWFEEAVSDDSAYAIGPNEFGICRWNGQEYDNGEIPGATSFRLGHNEILSHRTGFEVRIDPADSDSSFYADTDDPNDVWALGSHTLTRYRFVSAVQPLTFLTCQTLALRLYRSLPDTQTAQQFALCFDRLLRDQIKDS